MTPRPGPELWAAAAITAVLCALLLRRLTTYRTALAVAAVKVVIPLIYFAFYYDGSWTIIDDVSYYRAARVLLGSGYNPLTALVDPKGFATLLFLSNGNQFLYTWYNLLMQYLYGDSYWAAVLGNVVLTCIAANALRGLSRDVGASEGYSRTLAIFFALQWEVVAWSSLLNVKDILVMTLTVYLLWGFTRLAMKFSWRDALWTGAVAIVLFPARFYVPLVATVAFWLYAFGDPRRWNRYVVFGAIPLIVALVYASGYLPNLAGLLRLDAGDLAFGWLRTLLSPQPWSLQRGYGFLEVPSILQLFTLPLLIYGAYLLLRERTPLRLAFIYAALLLIAVAAIPELQGPRHRIQILFLLAWAQFHGAYAAASALATRTQHGASRITAS